MNKRDIAELRRMAGRQGDDLSLCGEAAAYIERLQAALEPFAGLTASEKYISDKATPDHGLCAGMSYTAGDYRRARAALKGKG